jgi:RNA polymerase sigma-70 factor (ECF subfamily)
VRPVTGELRVYETDPALVRAAATGDTAAFEQLVRDHQQPVWRFLRRLLGDDALAEDVTQETFVRVFRRLSSYTFEAKFSTWLFQIARNAGIDELRRRERQARLHEATAAAAARSADTMPAPDVHVELQAALDSLPTDLREALLLVEVLGLRYREAGVALGIPEGTVKSRAFHARRRLHGWANAAEPALRDRSGAEVHGEV